MFHFIFLVMSSLCQSLFLVVTQASRLLWFDTRGEFEGVNAWVEIEECVFQKIKPWYHQNVMSKYWLLPASTLKSSATNQTHLIETNAFLWSDRRERRKNERMPMESDQGRKNVWGICYYANQPLLLLLLLLLLSSSSSSSLLPLTPGAKTYRTISLSVCVYNHRCLLHNIQWQWMVELFPFKDVMDGESRVVLCQIYWSWYYYHHKISILKCRECLCY